MGFSSQCKSCTLGNADGGSVSVLLLRMSMETNAGYDERVAKVTPPPPLLDTRSVCNTVHRPLIVVVTEGFEMVSECSFG